MDTKLVYRKMHLLSTNHWLIIITLFLTWNQIIQAIDLSKSNLNKNLESNFKINSTTKLLNSSNLIYKESALTFNLSSSKIFIPFFNTHSNLTDQKTENFNNFLKLNSSKFNNHALYKQKTPVNLSKNIQSKISTSITNETNKLEKFKFNQELVSKSSYLNSSIVLNSSFLNNSMNLNSFLKNSSVKSTYKNLFFNNSINSSLNNSSTSNNISNLFSNYSNNIFTDKTLSLNNSSLKNEDKKLKKELLLNETKTLRSNHEKKEPLTKSFTSIKISLNSKNHLSSIQALNKLNNVTTTLYSKKENNTEKNLKTSIQLPSLKKTNEHFFYLTNQLNKSQVIEKSIDSSSKFLNIENNQTIFNHSSELKKNYLEEILLKKNLSFSLKKNSLSENNNLCLKHGTWPTTECSEIAILNCTWPYTGLSYRFCYSSCQWSKVDKSKCRLARLSEIHNLILYHVHKHLSDGLYPLVEELKKVIVADTAPILSPIDRIDTFDSLNAIFYSPALNVHFDSEDSQKRIRELNFVKSILKISDTIISSKLIFETETEKNSMISLKTTESLIGLRRLIENILRALIVQAEQNVNIKDDSQFSLLNSSNLILMLMHRTQTGELNSLFSNEPQLPDINRLPHTALHLEELKDYGAGIAILSINSLINNNYLENGKWKLLANPLLVTIVPAISLAANFEQTPTVNVEFSFYDKYFPLSQPVHCVILINSSKNSWTRSKCMLIKRNTTTAQCACSEIGYISIVTSKGGHFNRNEDALGNLQNYSSKIHKSILISSSVLSLIILITIINSLLSIITKNLRKTKDQKNNKKINKSINNLNKESKKKIKFFKKMKIENKDYCLNSQFIWLIIVCIYALIQLFWSTGVLFASTNDEFTIYKFWKNLIAKYNNKNTKSFYMNSSWSFTLQTKNNDLINILDNQQNCLNVALFLHFLFTSSSLWMLLNTFNLYKYLKKKNSSILNFDKLIIKKKLNESKCSLISSNDKHPIPNYQISSIRQLAKELNQINLNDKQLNYNLEKKYSKSFNPSKFIKKTLFKIFIYIYIKIKENFNNFVYYSICWIIAAFITILSYKLNPSGYETKRFCWMSIEGGITYSFIVPVSLIILLNTILVILALREYLCIQRLNYQTSSILLENDELSEINQLNYFNETNKNKFIFNNSFININLFVCCLPAFSIYWFFGVLALEQTQTTIFQFIIASLNLFFSGCLFFIHLPYVKDDANNLFEKICHADYLFKNDIRIVDDISTYELIDEELIIYTDSDEN